MTEGVRTADTMHRDPTKGQLCSWRGQGGLPLESGALSGDYERNSILGPRTKPKQRSRRRQVEGFQNRKVEELQARSVGKRLEQEREVGRQQHSAFQVLVRRLAVTLRALECTKQT